MNETHSIRFVAYLEEFQGHQLETFLLESLDDFSNEAAMNTVGFDHQIGTFFVISHICKCFAAPVALKFGAEVTTLLKCSRFFRVFLRLP